VNALARAFRAVLGGRTGGRDPLGPRGERIAMKHLRAKGHRKVGANVRLPAGEIDLLTIAPDGRTVVVVEVKAKRIAGDERGAPPPEASVHERKRAKLRLLAQQAARARGWTDRPLRIDVVAVDVPERGRPAVRHYENAVRG